MPRQPRNKARRRKGAPGLRVRLRLGSRWRVLAALALVAATGGAGCLLYLWVAVTTRFDGRLWKQPARIYSASLSVEAGDALNPTALTARLDRSGYARVEGAPSRPGQYRVAGDSVTLRVRPFVTPLERGEETGRTVRFRGDRVAALYDERGRRVDRLQLEPELLATLYGPRREERTVVELDQVPAPLLQAVLAAEDSRFFRHHGLDLRGILRAAAANVRAGGIVQGGSTITQQTVKNLFLGQERTFWRKARESLMSLILDARYSKERILEVYLNEVYLGQRGSVAICGLQSAARFYFGRDLAHLTRGEDALLAGLIRSPGSYNPFRHPDRAIERRNQVLDAMVRLGRIDEDAAREARDEPLQLASGSLGFDRAAYAVDWVQSTLATEQPEALLQTDGLRVYTTIDTALQGLAEEALDQGLERLERDVPTVHRQLEARRLQGAIVIARPSDGAILALVGGRDHATTQFNRAVQARRQPGSCFKPFVYAAGFELALRGEPGGLTPGSLLEDTPLQLVTNGKRWEPENYDRQHRGLVTAREALELSLNVPTVRAGQQIGLSHVIDLAHRAGIRSSLAAVPSLVLGTSELTPLELTEAYATLARGGLHVPSWIIRAVAGPDGNAVVTHETQAEPALGSGAAEMVEDVLRGVLDRGTARSARALGYEGVAAGKTGTTDDTRDAWFAGYTERLLTLVWVGYDDNGRTGLTGASGALPIWVRIMREADPDGMRRRLPRSDDLVRVTICLDSGMRATRHCPHREERVFPRGREPQERCRLHEGRFRRWLRRVFGDEGTI